jgi:RNA polymerase sigma factor (sigma-70 family)
MSDVTLILSRIDRGDPTAAAQLLPLVYDELRKLAAAKLAHEKPGQTLQATALVHEAYLRLIGSGARVSGLEVEGDDCHLSPPAPNSEPRAPAFDSRGHFFAAAAEAMRRILIDQARRKLSQKQGGNLKRVDAELELLAGSGPRDPAELMAVHEALEGLARKSPRKAELVKLRYFLGCTIPEAAEVLGVAAATAEEDWTYARAWLRREWLRD